MQRLRSAAVAAAVLAAACVPASAAPRAFGYDDIFRIVSVAAPQLSPDGTRVLAVVTRIDRAHDKRVHDLDVIDVATGARRTLVKARPGLSSARWSPRGDRIAFIADRPFKGDDSRPQVYDIPAGGGVPLNSTLAPEGVEQFAWRPDGKALAYVAIDPKPKATGDARFVDAYRVGNDPALAHGAARTARVWLQPWPGGRPRLLTRGAGSVTYGEGESTLSFSPDGATLAYLHAPTAVLNDADEATARLIDVATGRERPLGASASHERSHRVAVGWAPQQAAIYARLIRGSLIEAMSQDYIRTARAKGLTERRVVLRHGVRSAINPILTILGLDIGILLGSSVLVETVFDIPGIGRLNYDAITHADFPIVQGTVLFAALFIIVANILVDIAYAYLDPRVRYS